MNIRKKLNWFNTEGPNNPKYATDRTRHIAIELTALSEMEEEGNIKSIKDIEDIGFVSRPTMDIIYSEVI
jgi:hypothetical protein